MKSSQPPGFQDKDVTMLETMSVSSDWSFIVSMETTFDNKVWAWRKSSPHHLKAALSGPPAAQAPPVGYAGLGCGRRPPGGRGLLGGWWGSAGGAGYPGSVPSGGVPLVWAPVYVSDGLGLGHLRGGAGPCMIGALALCDFCSLAPWAEGVTSRSVPVVGVYYACGWLSVGGGRLGWTAALSAVPQVGLLPALTEVFNVMKDISGNTIIQSTCSFLPQAWWNVSVVYLLDA